MNDKCIDVDLYQSIQETYGPNNTVLSMEVSLFERLINTHLYCIGTDTTCPDYRGVLILECTQGRCTNPPTCTCSIFNDILKYTQSVSSV